MKNIVACIDIALFAVACVLAAGAELADDLRDRVRTAGGVQ